MADKIITKLAVGVRRDRWGLMLGGNWGLSPGECDRRVFILLFDPSLLIIANLLEASLFSNYLAIDTVSYCMFS